MVSKTIYLDSSSSAPALLEDSVYGDKVVLNAMGTERYGVRVLNFPPFNGVLAEWFKVPHWKCGRV